MTEPKILNIFFLNVGHGDSAFIILPNEARMMIDCGGSQNWASKLLKHNGITKKKSPNKWGFALDKLVISHPHGDHISDIISMHDDIGFKWLTGNYREFIDNIDSKNIDWRKRNSDAVKKFITVVKKYKGEYKEENDNVAASNPPCIVKSKRFLPTFEKGMDLNELSFFTSFEIGGHKILFTGDMTAEGVKKILKSSKADDFKLFVKGTTILKVPHHGRENGCSEEMFNAFKQKPLLCVVSDKILDETNEGTSNIAWYEDRTSDQKIMIDGKLQSRLVLTTRKDKDIFISISDKGNLDVKTNYFSELRKEIL